MSSTDGSSPADESSSTEDSPSIEEREDRRSARASVVFGGLLLLAGVVVVVDALRLPRTTAVIPPAAVPLPVGVLLGVVGVALVVRSRRALAGAAPGEPREPGGALRVFALVLAIVAFALLLPLLGYVVCSAALFSVAAMLLGAPRTWQTVAAGWALAALVFLVFDRLIGLTLPAGPWGF